LLLIGIILIPEFWAFLMSLQEVRVGIEPKFQGLTNYIAILSDPEFWSSFSITLRFIFFANISSFLIGLGIATVLSKGFPLQRFWVALILAPYAVSPVVGVVMWKYMLDYNVGVVNYILSFFGIGRLKWLADPNLTFVSILLVDIWRETPFIVIILYAAIISLPSDYFESARIDGASAWKIFLYITFPLITPAVLVAMVFRLIFSFRTFDVIWIMTKGGPARATEVMAIHLYLRGFYYWDYGAASAIAWIMLIITMIMSIYIIRIMYRRMFGQ
jgi:multiple sugar transport system permease protein